jgi:hypothetical protein
VKNRKKTLKLGQRFRYINLDASPVEIRARLGEKKEMKPKTRVIESQRLFQIALPPKKQIDFFTSALSKKLQAIVQEFTNAVSKKRELFDDKKLIFLNHKTTMTPKEPINHFHGNLKNRGKNSTKKTSYSSRKQTIDFFKPQKNLKFTQVGLGKNSAFANGIAFFNGF